MKTGTIKPNSYTQQRVQTFKNTLDQVLTNFQIDTETYYGLLFEYGCAFVEDFVGDKKEVQYLLQNPSAGFWHWWRLQWLTDDETLLRFKEFGASYAVAKWDMTVDLKTQQAFVANFG